METLKGQRAVVTGGSRGLGLGIVEALVAQGAQVTVVARNQERLVEISTRLGVDVVCGDITDRDIAWKVLQDVRPTILILNAGATPVMGQIHELSWESFNTAWENDVKGSFHWLQEVINMPLSPGSRVIFGSSGAALNSGSPLSGSYSGAKRMQLFMAGYANGISKALNLGIHFQAIAPLQIMGETDLGLKAAEAYARRRGVSTETMLASFGVPMQPRQVGEHVVSILTDPQYENGVVFGLKGDKGIVGLDG